ncbi:transglutaminase-like cysteine peptidase [Phenylobacterium sp.]|uniref:transglutaminase-like cysteine peptidase n=1 Tax=Phenylobacterium sp. TaxID=1871053 RepID=UPI0035227AA4
MVLSEAAAAPNGYLDFCRRQPQDCGGAPAPVVRKVAEMELARRGASNERSVAAGLPRHAPAAQQVNWTQAFAEARRRREMAEISNAAVAAAMVAVQQAELEPRTDAPWASHAGLQRVSYTATVQGAMPGTGPGTVADRRASRSQPPVMAQAAPATLDMTPELWSQINKANDKVNRAIGRRSDLATYGVQDHWATPLAQGTGFGDCEDYVLEKRRALIAGGVPETALSIAVATTSWGEHHAVLLVDTAQGAYVLDSLTPWVLPWRKANLIWHERQVAGAPFRWSMVDVTGAPRPVAPAPAATLAAQPAAQPADRPEGELRPSLQPAEPLALAQGYLALRGRL